MLGRWEAPSGIVASISASEASRKLGTETMGCAQFERSSISQAAAAAAAMHLALHSFTGIIQS